MAKEKHETVDVVLIKPAIVKGKGKKEGETITVTKAKAEILKVHGFIDKDVT